MKKILAFFRSLPARWKLIWPLAKNDFRSKYATSQLGMFWAFFRPIVMASVYIFVFSVIGRAAPVGGIYPYSLWMLPGVIVWFVFSDSVASGVSTLTEYSYLVKNIKFNISVLPAVKVVAAFIIHVFFVLLIILIYLISGLFDRIFIDWYWVGKTKAWIIPGTEDLMPYIYGKTLIGKWLSTVIGFPVLAVLIAWGVSRL